ncbi:hypothetical protein SEA_EWALD_9 [Gordonia phage Ewald]|nr:hypothetical protein SEA_EWALD_9 [Gordonia phage Ewald]
MEEIRMFVRLNNTRRAALAMAPNDGGTGEGGGDGSGDGAGAGGGAGAGAAGQGKQPGQGGDRGDGDGAGADGGDGGEWKSERSKNEVLADLRKERDEKAALQKQLDDINDKNKTDEQRKTEADEKRERDAAAAVLKAAQYEAAAAADLPLSWAKRITGATPEEMAADAKELKAEMDKQTGAGQTTDGAGASGSGDAAAAASPGMGRANAYYANQK